MQSKVNFVAIMNTLLGNGYEWNTVPS